MRTVGIVAEYNPFHNGHAYQLEKAKELTGADYAVVVMSGNFVQRGYPAIVDKYCRAEMALRAGADLVLELPVSYATGSAEAFAQGAVSVLDSLGCVDALCFGSEAGNLSALLPYAQLFEDEPASYRSFLQEFLRQGQSFPAARSRAAEEYLNLSERILPCCSDDADCRRKPQPDHDRALQLRTKFVDAVLVVQRQRRKAQRERQNGDPVSQSPAHNKFFDRRHSVSLSR